MPYIAVGGSRLYYEEYGQAQRPAMVLLHGVGGNHASWFHQTVAWRDQFRVIVPDARGFGNSGDAEGVGRSGFVDDLTALLDTLDIDSAILVGQSMGGGTAGVFTCRYPHRVRALVLADTLMSVDLPDEIRPFMQELGQRTIKLSQLQRVLSGAFCEQFPHMAALYLALASFNSVNVHTLGGTLPAYRPQELAATQVPVLYVVGEGDILFPPQAVAAVHRHTPRSTLQVLPQAGHSAYFEVPDAFNACVRDWLRAQGVA